MPKISIIMPAYNSEDFIEEAIHSVLNQTFQDFELIVVDDCSKDCTAVKVQALAEKYPSKIVFIKHEVNQGAAQARNTAISYSKANVLMLADSDDIQHEERLETTYNQLLSTGTDMVFHDCEMIDAEGRKLNRTKGYPVGISNDNVVLHMLKRNYFWTSLTMIRKSPDVKFDSSLPNAEDFDLFLSLFIKGYTFSLCDKVLTQYRIHGNNISGDAASSENSVRRIYQKLQLPELLESLQKKHESYEAGLAVAAAYLWRNEPQEAIAIMQKFPYSLESYFMLAVSYYKLENYAQSLFYFKEIDRVEAEGANTAVWNNIGVLIYKVENDKEQAEQWFNKAISKRSDYLDAQRNKELLETEEDGRLKITERPLRAEIVHGEHYKVN